MEVDPPAFNIWDAILRLQTDCTTFLPTSSIATTKNDSSRSVVVTRKNMFPSVSMMTMPRWPGNQTGFASRDSQHRVLLAWNMGISQQFHREKLETAEFHPEKWGFPKMVPKNRWFIRENPTTKMDDLGVPPF